MKTHRVVITGAVLSRLFATCCSSQTPFDGLLFGNIRSRAKDVYDDNQEAVSHQETILMVTNVVSSVKDHSFFDGAGKINNHELEMIVMQCRDPLIGWCSFGMENLEPSLIHKRVTHNMIQPIRNATEAAAPSKLLMMLHLAKEHHEATVSFQYLAFVSEPSWAYPEIMTDETSGRVLVPIPVQILNLEDHRGEGRYTSFCPSSFNSMTTSIVTSPAMDLIAEMENLDFTPQEAIAQGLMSKAEKMMREYAELCQKVKSECEEVNRRKEKMATLKAKLT